MHRRAAGALTLTVALLIALVVPGLLAPGVAGHPQRAALPAAPSVGDCLTQTRLVVDCDRPHRWEVTASRSATDPARLGRGDGDACEVGAQQYGHLSEASAIAGWTARLTVITVLLDAPPQQRAGPDGWTVCALQPAWVDSRTGSLSALRIPAEAPEVFSMCLDWQFGLTGVDCRRPHNVQVLGTRRGVPAPSSGTGVPAFAADLQSELESSCRSLAAALTGAPDPTYGGQLTLRVDLDLPAGPDRPALPAGDPPSVPTPSPDGTVTYSATCIAFPSGGRLLTGSLTALGGNPLPLV